MLYKSNKEEFEINTIVLDLNGTLAVKGIIVEGAIEKIKQIIELGIKVVLFSGDQRGDAVIQAQKVGVEFKLASTGEEKERLFLEFDKETTAAIGNARIDNGKFKHAKLSIATLQAEGIHTGILEHVDIIVPSINDALDLFLDHNSMAATMRQ